MIWSLLPFIAMALNVIATVAGLAQFLRYRRVMRHAFLLDQLLMRLCVEVFTRQHQPIWQAWTQSMGHIKVEVVAVRKAPGGTEND